jgi:hypothetical protein
MRCNHTLCRNLLCSCEPHKLRREYGSKDANDSVWHISRHEWPECGTGRSLTPCILDDDPAQLELLSEMIAGLGYDSLPTSDPEEALRLV